ncbi:MAG: ABC transporter ATP-binding protein [Firmicutes bacterium]|nr:ABC transporter ATP-binding protein [Bacillota bacterium]
MADSPAIIVQDLVKRYRHAQTLALKGLNFHVNSGEIFGYLGPNGAGKTTTIRILAGLSRPTKGYCRVLGQDTASNPTLYNHLGVVFEESHLYERLSGLENLRFFASLHGVPQDRVLSLLEEYGLAKAAKRPVGTYSKGMKRRLLICRALLHDPDVLVMDEPTSGLDPTSAGVIHRAIEAFRRQGKTIFLSTHDMAEADALCDRVAFINQGQIAALDRPSTLKRQYGQPVIVVEMQPGEHGVEAIKGVIPTARISWEEDLVKVSLPLDQPDLGTSIDRIREYGEVLTIHSQEASLGQVFQTVTGAGLH